MDIEKLLFESFQTAYQTALPGICLPPFIPKPPTTGKLIVVGAGKASAAMAQSFEAHYDGPIEGLVITRYGFSKPTSHIKIIEASHPVPDENGLRAAKDMLDLLENADETDTVLCLISGGGSSLLSRPIDGVSFENLQDLQRALLNSGADITEMNIVRKHLNVALGGGLAQAAGKSKLITLAISDVVGDDPGTIASGASVPDLSTLSEAQAILERYSISVPSDISAALKAPNNETPKPDDPIFDGHKYHLIATPANALNAAKEHFERAGYHALIWDAEVEGDTEDAALNHAQYLQDIIDGKHNIPLPCVIISGGETTMNMKTYAKNKGGPNTHFMLKCADLLAGNGRIYGIACDTDGIDGHGDHAGAIITPETLQKSTKKKLDIKHALQERQSYKFFAALGDLIKTGPTYTNVNDYRAFLVLP